MSYRHTQVGTVILVSMGLAVVGMVGLALATEWNPIGLAALGVVAVCGALFGSLTIEVGEGALSCRFGPGLIRKRWPLGNIREARVVRNPWYYGWGIHWTPHGWLYNVSGLGAVEIALASGKKARIGSNEPEKLAEAIRRGLTATKQ